MRKLAYLAIACATVITACGAEAPQPSPQPTAEPQPAATATPRPNLPNWKEEMPLPFPFPEGAFAPVDAFVQAQQLGRGVNFGNMLEAPKEGEWGLVVREEYFPLVRQAGFDTVRVPIRWSAHALRQPPYTIAPEFFQRIDWVIENALQNDLNVVINMHHYEELFKDLEGERERFLVLWDQIATRYRNLPPEVLFEPLNEPHGALDNESWEELFKQVLAIIRRTNPHRNVIFTGADMGTLNGLLQAKRPNDDPHLIATFHYYLPFAFTHQGAEWVEGSSAWLGTSWRGNGTQRANVDYDMDRAVRWGKQNNMPVWMGEFGAYSKADLDSRVAWTNYVARAAEARGLTWAYWEFGSGFGVYDPISLQWNEPILNVLIQKQEATGR
jgi:endoglucanase